jgi:flavin-dependent dehydrogenase
MSTPSNYDTIIIGAGPAGSSASALLAERGMRVLVLEREKFPRYHIGESLLPFTVETPGTARANAKVGVRQKT